MAANHDDIIDTLSAEADKSVPKIKVSVIVPIHNGADYIRATIDCILGQTLPELEIILVDDHSVDDSYSICQEYAEKHYQVRAIRNASQTRGVSAARNAGIGAAGGEYLAFVDSDDRIDSDMYEVMYDMAATSSLDFVHCDFKTVFTNGRTTRSSNSHPKNVLLDRDYLLDAVVPSLVGIVDAPQRFIGSSSCTNIFRTQLLREQNLRFDESRMKFEDRLFVVEFLSRATSGAFVDEPYYTYVKRQGSLSTRHHLQEGQAVIENQIRYRELFGDVYDFDSPTAINYRTGAIIDVVWSIITGEPQEARREKAEELLSNSHVRGWMLQLPTEHRKPALSLAKLSLAADRSDIAYIALALHLAPRRARRFAGSIWRKWRTRTAS